MKKSQCKHCQYLDVFAYDESFGMYHPVDEIRGAMTGKGDYCKHYGNYVEAIASCDLAGHNNPQGRVLKWLKRRKQ